MMHYNRYNDAETKYTTIDYEAGITSTAILTMTEEPHSLILPLYAGSTTAAITIPLQLLTVIIVRGKWHTLQASPLYWNRIRNNHHNIALSATTTISILMQGLTTATTIVVVMQEPHPPQSSS